VSTEVPRAGLFRRFRPPLPAICNLHAPFSGKYDTVSDLDVPLRGLYLLAAPSTPDEVQQEVIARAENGETFRPSAVPVVRRSHGIHSRQRNGGWHRGEFTIVPIQLLLRLRVERKIQP
jgi:hypothetical protein